MAVSIVPGFLYLLTGSQKIHFRRGVGEEAVIGTTNEEVLEVVRDHIAFQNSEVPCEENRVAMAHIVAAIEILEQRSAKRNKQQLTGMKEQHEA